MTDPIPNFEEVVRSRRSVRLFEDTAVPDELVDKALDLALLAPNSSNLQPWEFHWVRSEPKKQELVKACLSQPAAATAQHLIVCVARTKTWKKHRQLMLEALAAAEREGATIPKAAFEYYQKVVPFVYTGGPFGLLGYLKSLLAFVIGLFRPIPRELGSPPNLKIWAIKTTALACENLMLALRSLGLDSCPMEGMDSSRIKRLLNLPSDASVVMVIGIGYRRPNGVSGPQIRFDRNLFVKRV